MPIFVPTFQRATFDVDVLGFVASPFQFTLFAEYSATLALLYSDNALAGFVSNTTDFTMTGIPAFLEPAQPPSEAATVMQVTNNNISRLGVAKVQIGGSIVFGLQAPATGSFADNGWTAAGFKGFPSPFLTQLYRRAV